MANKKYKDILDKQFLYKEYIVNKRSTHSISKQLGCTDCTVRNYMIFFGIKRRTLSEAQKCKPEISEFTRNKFRKRLGKLHGSYGKKYPGRNAGRKHPRFGFIESRESVEKRMKKIFAVITLSPNKPETILKNLLNTIFPNEYKFVGDGKFWINGFNPDFVNCNGQKKIIEMYGDYWHNLPNYKKRDIRRLISYKKYGYQTLIIWEKELKDPEMVMAKLMEFDLK